MKAKRFLSMILVVALLLSICPTAVAATLTSGNCGVNDDNLTWTLDADGLLTISGDGAMADYESYAVAPWRNLRDSVRYVAIEDGVTTIGKNAFKDCTSITSVIIPDSVTTIGKFAFFGCTSLASVTIPDSVTTIKNDAFYSCSALTSIVIPDSVTTIESGTFGNCTSLASVTIPDSVTTIEETAFYSCSALTSIVIPASVDYVGKQCFMHCDALTSVTFTGDAPEIHEKAFYDIEVTCYYPVDNATWTQEKMASYGGILTWDPPVSGTCGANVEWSYDSGTLTISGKGDMYNYGSSRAPWYAHRAYITSVAISDGVTTIGEMAFSECEAMTSITIPDSVTSIGRDAFEYCKSLASITIPASVTFIGDYAFYSALDIYPELPEITFEGNAPEVDDPDGNGRIDIFNNVWAIVYYPADAEGWTEEFRNSFTGTLTWVPYEGPSDSLSFDPATLTICKGESATVSLVLDTDITVLGGTVTVSAKDGSGNELEIRAIAPHNIADCTITSEGSKIVIATLGTIAAGTKIVDITFATNDNTAAGNYTVTLESELYTGDVASNDNDAKIDFAVNNGTITVTEKPVTVIWKNDDGTVLETDENVAYGTIPAYNNATPTKASTEQYDYTFKGWSPAVGAVTEDTVYTATYTATLRNYTLTFQNEAGETIETLTVPYGTEPEDIDGIPDVPEKPSTAEFSYIANNWGVQKVTGPATYKASYTAQKRSYTITWLNADGSKLGTTTVEYGAMPSFADPTKDKDVGYTYTFKQWDPAVAEVTGEATYTATYTQTARTYAVSVEGVSAEATLVIKDGGGNEIQPTNGAYNLTYNQTYSYELTALGYKTETGSFTMLDGNNRLEFNSNEETAVLTFGDMEKFVGDLDGDGVIMMTEAQALYNFILGRYEVDEDGLAYDENGTLAFNKNVADINGNGTVGADDILPMLRLVTRVVAGN